MPTLTQPSIVRHVVHAIGDGLAQLFVQKVVNTDFLRLRPAAATHGPPFLNSPTNSFFFVSTEITG